jgi:hypothetical protein
VAEEDTQFFPQFTCFTGTKVQILTQKALQEVKSKTKTRHPPPRPSRLLQVGQYWYFCTSKASKVSACCASGASGENHLQPARSQYLYFCTSKASKLSTCCASGASGENLLQPASSQYLYFCTSKASKLSTCCASGASGENLLHPARAALEGAVLEAQVLKLAAYYSVYLLFTTQFNLLHPARAALEGAVLEAQVLKLLACLVQKYKY